MSTYRHKKRGTLYELIGYGEMQTANWYQEGEWQGESSGYDYDSIDMRKVAVYRSLDDGAIWVRPIEEFEDGRFEIIETPPLLSQEEAFQRAVKAGMWNGLVSKPEEVAK